MHNGDKPGSVKRATYVVARSSYRSQHT